MGKKRKMQEAQSMMTPKISQQQMMNFKASLTGMPGFPIQEEKVSKQPSGQVGQSLSQTTSNTSLSTLNETLSQRTTSNFMSQATPSLQTLNLGANMKNGS